jgi:hypothetical protein
VIPTEGVRPAGPGSTWEKLAGPFSPVIPPEGVGVFRFQRRAVAQAPGSTGPPGLDPEKIA